MTEISELSNSIYGSDIDSNDDTTTMVDNTVTPDKCINYYPFRCEKCYSNIIFETADFIDNIFSVKCNNNHLYTYKSYKDLIDNTNKDLAHLLCHYCKNSIKNERMLKCNECNLFICYKCKKEHIHSNFTELENIDTKNNINIVYDDVNSPLENEIKKEHQQILDNIELFKKIRNKYEQWLKKLINHTNNHLNSLHNYLLCKHSCFVN